MPWYWPFKRTDDTYVSDRSSLLEGISNDSLLFFFLVASIIGLWIYYSRRHRSTTIHPDNRQDVELLRQRSSEQGDNLNRATSSSQTSRSEQDTCPICLNDLSVLTVVTNCGHSFCGKCITTFWKFQSNWMSGMKCPVCRQQVTVLLSRFTAQEQASADSTDRQMVLSGVKDFNRRFSGAPRTWLEYFHDIPVLIPHIIRQIFTTESLAWTYRIRTFLIFISVIAYVISPLDILPESILGIFGLVDDFFIILCSALYVIIAFREHLSRG